MNSTLREQGQSATLHQHVGATRRTLLHSDDRSEACATMLCEGEIEVDCEIKISPVQLTASLKRHNAGLHRKKLLDYK